MDRRYGRPLVTARRESGFCWLLVTAALVLGACKKPKPPPPSPTTTPVSTAATTGAPLSPRAQVAASAAPPAPVDPLRPAERAALERAKATLAEVEALVKLGALTNPQKPEDGDATVKCAALEDARSQLEPIDDAAAKKALADIKRLCSLEVPILGADNALKQVTNSPSQASHKLMCGFASKDLEKARRVSPYDRRVQGLDGRFAHACR
jgi:hypothetical protein